MSSSNTPDFHPDALKAADAVMALINAQPRSPSREELARAIWLSIRNDVLWRHAAAIARDRDGVAKQLMGIVPKPSVSN